MRQFVPMTDDLLYDRDRLTGPLVPYQCGMRCLHELRDEAWPDRAPAVANDAEVSASR